MDYLQYSEVRYDWNMLSNSFKPYYKWITFNTHACLLIDFFGLALVLNLIINGLPSILKASSLTISPVFLVLNLIINGLPSIQFLFTRYDGAKLTCFKPYYKWITFNTKTYLSGKLLTYSALVLNLIINGLPSIQNSENLVNRVSLQSFKPYYKWITFNTDIW